ncbi:S-protein homolog 5 [Brassica rapa]|nr:S-protein homolog 5 [Brassica rapa]
MTQWSLIPSMTSSKKNHFILVLSTLLFILQTPSSLGNHSSSDGFFPWAPKHVVIINKLTTHARLIVHCTNKNKDLGIKELAYGASFDFRFHVNFRKTTTYTCSFEWPKNKVRFDIFSTYRDDNVFSKVGVCRECIWYIYEPAPCRAKRDGGASICFGWDS